MSVVEARELEDADSFVGLNDVYAEVYLNDDYKQRTATVHSQVNPQWDETVHL